MALTRLDNLYSSKTGKYLYVSPDDYNATDELDNRGNSPLRPFKTIQRAFIEVARFSYLPGANNDRFDQFSIMLMPGDHYIDNRPGLVNLDDDKLQRYLDARNLIQANRQEIIDRAFGEIAIQYDETAWGVDWVVPGDDPNSDRTRFYDAYRLIQINRQEIIDRAIAHIAINFPAFYIPEDPAETEVSRFKDAYRLIKNNEAEIATLAVAAAVAEPAFSGFDWGANQARYEADVTKFVDAVALDIFAGGSNVYSRKFAQSYFSETTGNLLVPYLNENQQYVYVFEQARDLINQAITNQLTYEESVTGGSTGNGISPGESVYGDGNGDVANTDPTACFDVQSANDVLTTTVTSVFNTATIGGLAPESTVEPPAGEAKCRRDIGFVIDYTSLDVVQGGGNLYTRKLLQNYFDDSGLNWVDDGLQGETAESRSVFDKAREVSLLAITNQLYAKDLTITGDAATGGSNTDPAACANVQTLINNLFLTIDTIIAEEALTNLPPEEVIPDDPGESKCKRDIGYIVDAVAADLANDGNSQSIAAAKSYFDEQGVPLLDGVVDEEAQSIVAFNRAGVEMRKAVTNQLLSKDLTILPGPAVYGNETPIIPNLPSGNAAACVDVQSSIDSLISIIVTALDEGDLSSVNSLQVTGSIPIFNYNQSLDEWNDNTILDLSNPDNALYKFNSSTGGAIVPRGCSLVGYDLRRTIVRPLYVPDPADGTQERTSIFNLTGGCYLWQFTIKDGDISENSPLYDTTDRVGKVYYQKGNSTSLTVPEYSHHKITIMTYADDKDLEQYYEKVGRSFSLYQPTIDDGDLEALVQENRIVGPLSDTRNITNIRLEDNADPTKTTIVVTTKIAHGYFKEQFVAIIDTGLSDLLNGTFKVTELDDDDPRVFKYEVDTTELVLGLDINAQGYDFTTVPALNLSARVQAEIDSVESASPYVFNCSIRSTWGQCGMWADGSKATGFKSMVVAQYTGVSLQRDDRAYIRYDEFTNTWNQASIQDAFATVPYHTKGDAYWKDDWRNFHIRASDDAFIQCVSVFAVGFFDHFLMESGGDMSITNSNSNFGNTSLHAIGFKGFAFNQDKGGYITDIVPVKTVDDSAFNEKQLKYYSLDAQVTKDISNTTGRLYYGSDETYDPFQKPTISIDGYRVGAKTGDTLFLNIKGTTGTTETYEALIEPNGFLKYTASIETLNPDGLTVDNYAQDASNSIERNRTFIQQEAYGYITQKYPYLLTKAGIDDIARCERDIGYFVDAVVQDLRVGGNIQTLQAAEAYFVSGMLQYIPGELSETLDALEYVKNLCISAMQNFDILIRNVQTTNGSPIVDVGDTTGLLVGMTVTEYEYNSTNFEYGRLLPGAIPASGAQQSIPTGAIIRRIIDGTRIELGDPGSKLSEGNFVDATSTLLNYVYFTFPQTATLTDSDDVLVGAWAAETPVRDSSITQDVAGGNPPTTWIQASNTYPECANVVSTISTYFDDISIVLNQGLQPISERTTALANLLQQNRTLIVEEAIDRIQLNDPLWIPNNINVLRGNLENSIDNYAYNITYGGNSRVYDQAVYYTSNPSVSQGEEVEQNAIYDEITLLSAQVLRQEFIIQVGDHGTTQLFNPEIVGDLSGEPGVYDVSDFGDVITDIDGFAVILKEAIGPDDVTPGTITVGRVEPVVGGSVTRVDPTLNTANLATRATLFTIDTGTGSTNPHNFETGTPVRLVPKVRAGVDPATVDKRVIRLPRGLETNEIYYVIAPGRSTQPEDYADGTTYPGIFEPSNGTKLMLARTKDNAAAGIYIYSSETDTVDPDVEIEIQQYVLDVDYSLHQYLVNEVPSINDVLQTDVPHVFDVPGSVETVHKVFFRTFGVNSTLPQFSTGPVDPNTYYYVRYITPKTFAVFLTEADAISGANRQVFASGFGENFYVFSDKRRSPVRFDAELVNATTTTGQWYLNSVPDIGNTQNIIDRLQTLGATLKDSRTKNTFYTRLEDEREKEDRVYRLRYVIPRYATGVRDPLNGFVIKVRTDETRKLLPQRILLEPLATADPLAVFNIPLTTPGGTIQQQLGLPADELDPDFSYDPYDIDQVKVVGSDQTDSKTSFSILSARKVLVGPDPVADARIELTVFNHGIDNDELRNEKFTVLKINAPQGGNFRVDNLQATALNRITWSGYSSGSGFLQAYFNVDGTDEHYIIIKAFEGTDPIEYSPFADTVFTQPVLDIDNDPTFDINGNPINIFATLQAKPDSAGSTNNTLSKSEKADYLYSNKNANVLTITPGDVIEDDVSNDYQVVSVEDAGEIEDSFYIFDINEIQRRIPNQQEGIYYLTCIKGNISPYPVGAGVGENFRNFKFSQPISSLYPLDYTNDPLWFQVQADGSRDSTILDPPNTICAADNYVHGLVTTNDNKNSTTKEVIFDLIENPALSRYDYTTTPIEAQSGNATAGAEDRRISISGDSVYPTESRLFVELRRPSIARSGNHTFEYLGFGPGNYSTGFPLRQEVVLSDIQDFYAQSKKEDAGIVFYTGLNSNGDLYIGNRKINAITGEETFLERAELLTSADEEGDLGGLVTTFELPVVFERDITVDGDANFNNPVTINVEPSEPPALTIVSNVNFAAGEDQALDSSSFTFSDIFSEGNIVLGKNEIYAGVYRLNPRGNVTLSGQNYSFRTHIDQDSGLFPTNNSPHQSESTLGIPILYGAAVPLTGDILLKGAQVDKSGSLGWIYSNFYNEVTSNIDTIAADNTTTVIFKTVVGTSCADLGISEGAVLRLTDFDNRLVNLNGLRTATNVTFDTFEITQSFIISQDPGDPTPLNTLSGTIEVSTNSWKETGVIGSETLRTYTDDWGDFRLGINTLARAPHGVGGDQENAWVSETTKPRANLDLLGNAFISGKALETSPVNNFIDNPDPTTRSFLNVDHAFLVGGNSDTPSDSATFRISTTNSGRVGINVPFADLDSTLVVAGTTRITDIVTFESDFTIEGQNLITTSSTFSLLPSNAETINFANVVKELNIGLLANTAFDDPQKFNIGDFVKSQEFSLGENAAADPLDGDVFTKLDIHTNSLASSVTLATTPADGRYSVIKMGGAYNNISDNESFGSLFRINNRFTYLNGDMRIGQALPAGTGVAKIQSNALSVDLFTTTVSNINFGLTSSKIDIGAFGGSTNVNNNFAVSGSISGFGDVTLFGGLNAGQFELRRGSFGTPSVPHSIGNEIDDFNIDYYRKVDINVLLDTEGASFWGDASFKDDSFDVDQGGGVILVDPTIYALPISGTASEIEFEIGSYILIDRSQEAFNSFGVSTQGGAPIGEEYSELLEVVGLINLNVIDEPLRVLVRRGRNQLDSNGNLIPDAGQASGYKYLRDDHPDNAVLIRYNYSRNVSFINENLNAEPAGTLDLVATGNFSGQVNIGDIFRLSPDENGNEGELAFINAIDQTSNQLFSINDGGSPSVLAFSVDSVSGDTYINGKLTVNKSICLEGTTAPDTERLVITDGGVAAESEKFIVDSSDGETFIRGDLRIGQTDFSRFVVDSEQGNTTITEGNLVIENNSGDQQFILQNSSGNLTIAGVIRTEADAENILTGDLTVNGGDFQVNNLVDDGGGNLIEDNIFRINNNGSIDFADQSGFFTPSGARKWEYIGGGVDLIDAVSNINYFIAPSADVYFKLPQNPTTGDVIRVVDVAGLLTFNVSLRFRAPNGVAIQGDTTNSDSLAAGTSHASGGELVVQTPNAALGLVYLGSLNYDGSGTGAPSTQQGWWLMEI